MPALPRWGAENNLCKNAENDEICFARVTIRNLCLKPLKFPVSPPPTNLTVVTLANDNSIMKKNHIFIFLPSEAVS